MLSELVDTPVFPSQRPQRRLCPGHAWGEHSPLLDPDPAHYRLPHHRSDSGASGQGPGYTGPKLPLVQGPPRGALHHRERPAGDQRGTLSIDYYQYAGVLAICNLVYLC